MNEANYKLCRFALFSAGVINLNERHLLLQVPAAKFAFLHKGKLLEWLN